MTSSRTELKSRAIRGRTRKGRLRLVDDYLCASFPMVTRVADIGFGAEPATTLELAARLPHAAVLGFETDPDRIPESTVEATFHRCNGFELDASIPKFGASRAINVLRGYAPSESAPAHEKWAQWLCDGGHLIEGTTTPDGELASFYDFQIQAGVIRSKSLVFAFSPSSRGFAPWMFRDWLPQQLRRSVTPGSAMFGFFERWTQVWSDVRGLGADEAFEASALRVLDDYEGAFLATENGAFLVRHCGRD